MSVDCLLAGIVSGWPVVKLRILRNGVALDLTSGAEAASIIKSGKDCQPVDVLGVDPVGSLPVASVNRLATGCRGLGRYKLPGVEKTVDEDFLW